MSNVLARRLLFVALFSTLLPCSTSIAAVKTWDGVSGDSLWQTGGNWDPNGLPTLDDDVVIDLPGEYTVTVLRFPWPLAASVRVDAADATLQLDGRSGDAVLQVATGGFVTNAGTLELINTGTTPYRSVVMIGGAGKLTNTGTIDVRAGTGGGDRYLYAVIENQGTIDIGLATTIKRWGLPGRAHVNSGTINVTGGDLTLDLDHANYLDSFTNTGTCNIAAGQTLNLEVGEGTFTNFGSQTLTGGTYNVAGTFKFSGADIVNNAATIVLDGPASQIVDELNGDALASFAANETSGSFTITNARDLTSLGPFANAGAVVVSTGSTLTVTGDLTQTLGSTTLGDGTVVAGLVDVQGGTLRGNGTVTGSVTVAGTIAAGLSVGRLAITGDLVLAAMSTVVVEIGGPDPGNEFDVIDVSGSVTLDGHLAVALINDYIPPVGAEFNVITASPRGGEFLTDNLPLLFGDNCMGADYRPNSVTLVALAGTTITTQPQSQEICEGDPVTFSVAADGFMPFDYQWRKNGVNIGGATGSSYTVASATTADAGNYDVVVTNYCGFESSVVATLTVYTAALITQQPASATVCEGDPVTFTVAVAGTPTPDLQWYKDGELLQGETGTTLTISSASVADAGSYTVEATNVCDSDTSTSAVLTVNTVPVITQQPTDATVCEGDLVTFTVAATGMPTPDLEWYKDGMLLPGETGTTLTISSASVADAGSYTVEATNVCGSETSHPAELVVMVPGPGDYELDCDVDLADFAGWPGCETGPDWGGWPFMPGCDPFDMDFDDDIDLQDFAAFQRAMAGP